MNNKYNSRLTVLFLGLSAVTLVACKGETTSDSSTQSLNNFARTNGAEVAQNFCSGSETLEPRILDAADFSRVSDPSQVPALKSALQSSLSAVPNRIQSMFFLAAGKIIFSNNLDGKKANSSDPSCNLNGPDAAFAGENTANLKACWIINMAKKEIEILMKPEVAAVQQSTVRMFGFLLAQVLTTITVDASGNPIPYNDTAFQSLLGQISNSVVSDLANSGGKYNIQDSVKNNPSFKYYAFAESFDSYYCNKDLRSSMSQQGQFPQTYALMTTMDTSIKNLPSTSQPASASTSSSGGSSGFGLASAPAIGDGLNLGILGSLFGGIASVLGGVVSGVVNLGGGILSGAGSMLSSALSGNGLLGNGGLFNGGLLTLLGF